MELFDLLLGKPQRLYFLAAEAGHHFLPVNDFPAGHGAIRLIFLGVLILLLLFGEDIVVELLRLFVHVLENAVLEANNELHVAHSLGSQLFVCGINRFLRQSHVSLISPLIIEVACVERLIKTVAKPSLGLLFARNEQAIKELPHSVIHLGAGNCG
ncbi:MAG: hypothetical protein PUG38_05425 [Sutterellaceae bacterium]|nr:hypothetical protein [Sutterellaceae bacterium]MDY2867886.1 hypothetical protein [Mesosutterella sp.]